jgi:hypothetical protein
VTAAGDQTGRAPVRAGPSALMSSRAVVTDRAGESIEAY